MWQSLQLPELTVLSDAAFHPSLQPFSPLGFVCHLAYAAYWYSSQVQVSRITSPVAICLLGAEGAGIVFKRFILSPLFPRSAKLPFSPWGLLYLLLLIHLAVASILKKKKVKLQRIIVLLRKIGMNFPGFGFHSQLSFL